MISLGALKAPLSKAFGLPSNDSVHTQQQQQPPNPNGTPSPMSIAATPSLGSVLGGWQMDNNYNNQLSMSQTRYKTYLLTISETSNGHVISCGNVTRVCTGNMKLLDEIAAVLAETQL